MNEKQMMEEWRQEAERLRLLDPQTRRDLVGMYRNKARNAKLPQTERRAAGERAKALAKLLKLPPL